jgi:hypothetical protein
VIVAVHRTRYVAAGASAATAQMRRGHVIHRSSRREPGSIFQVNAEVRGARRGGLKDGIHWLASTCPAGKRIMVRLGDVRAFVLAEPLRSYAGIGAKLADK